MSAERARSGWVFLAGVVARGIVGRCARAFAARNIPVMALKGVALHALVYEDEAERPLSDVDLLVPPRHHADAVRALEDAGFRRRTPATSWATTLAAPDVPLDVDLHRRLFPTGLYRLDSDALFARSTLDASRFGAPVRLPDPYDLYAHCVGHFAKTRMDARNTRAFTDLERIARATRIEPGRCAVHLDRAGLGRAARYTLGAMPEPDPFARAVLDALTADRLGDALALAARGLARACAQPSPISAPAAHLVNRGLVAGLFSFAAQAIESARR